jgi:hypothetical protein
MIMARRRETASGNGLTPEHCQRLERIVVELLEIAARCKDSEIQHELMRLADQLVELAEGMRSAQQAEKNLAADPVYETPPLHNEAGASPVMQQQQQVQPKKKV